MHLRAARARADARPSSRSCSAHEPAVRRAADRRPRLSSRIDQRGRGASELIARLSARARAVPLPRLARQPKDASFGWRYDFDDAASRQPSRSLTGSGRCGPRRPPSRDCAPGDFVHVLLARYDPGAGIGWHRDRDVFEQVVGVSLDTPATLRFRQRTESGFRRASVEVNAAVGLFALRRKPVELGASASHPAPSCASRSRSARFRALPEEAAKRSGRSARRTRQVRALAQNTLAHLVACKALRDPARRGQSAEVGRVERRVPFGEVDHAHPGIGREPPHGRRRNRLTRHPARPRARRRRAIATRSITSMSQSITSASQCATWSSARSIAWAMPESPHVADGNDEVAGLERVLVHRSAVGERSKADLRDIGAAEPILDQSAHRIAIARGPGRGRACRNERRA